MNKYLPVSAVDPDLIGGGGAGGGLSVGNGRPNPSELQSAPNEPEKYNQAHKITSS